MQTVIKNYDNAKKQRLNAVFYPQTKKLVHNRPPADTNFVRQRPLTPPPSQLLATAATEGGSNIFESLSTQSPTTQERFSVGSLFSSAALFDSPVADFTPQSPPKTNKPERRNKSKKVSQSRVHISSHQLSFGSILDSDGDFEDAPQSQRQPQKRKLSKSKRKKQKEKQPREAVVVRAGHTSINASITTITTIVFRNTTSITTITTIVFRNTGIRRCSQQNEKSAHGAHTLSQGSYISDREKPLQV